MNLAFQYPKWKACVILISLGIAILFLFGIRNLERDYRSLHWPVTSGVIRSVSMHGAPFNGPGADQNSYYSDIVYDYQVAGASYSGTRVTFGGLWLIYNNGSNKSQVRAVLDRYPVGKQVSVYYDPNAPETAVLEPKITDRTWTPLVFSVLFLLWGTLPIIAFIFRTRVMKLTPPNPGGPANRSQPGRQETNRASGTAGSGG